MVGGKVVVLGDVMMVWWWCSGGVEGVEVGGKVE